MINLSAQMNHLLYQSVIFVNMVEVIIVLTIFIKQIEKNELQLSEQANIDALTGISNRRYFFEQSESQIKLANSNNRPISLIMIDFDFFKTINDTHGHISGDLCLKEICTIIKKMNRTSDFFARFGGEEFVLLLPETTLIEAVKLAERIRSAIAEHTIVLNLKNSINCTASFGVSSNEEFNEELKQLIINADAALLKAKGQGRNRVLFFNKKLCT